MTNDIETQSDLSGLITPVATPFTDSGEVDESAFCAHLEFLSSAGVGKIMVNGTTGEFFSLTENEMRSLLVLANKYFSGTLIYHTGCVALADNIDQARFAVETGADAIACIAPFYFANAPADGIVDYFNAISESTDLPLMIYNFPTHTQNPMTPEILAKIDHFGMKDSSANLDLIPATKHYYVGGDAVILKAHRKGGYGFVSGRSNFIPEIFVKLESAINSGDDQADPIQQEIIKLKNAITGTGTIGKIKYALSKRIKGYNPTPRPPLKSINQTQADELNALLGSLGI